jgi:hypothetical protein
VRSDVNVTTPAAAIGIRGTEFWAGPIDNQALGLMINVAAKFVAPQFACRRQSH